MMMVEAGEAHAGRLGRWFWDWSIGLRGWSIRIAGAEYTDCGLKHADCGLKYCGLRIAGLDLRIAGLGYTGRGTRVDELQAGVQHCDLEHGAGV